MQNREKLTNILLPKGEWLDAMLTAFKVAGLELTAKPRSYEYTFVTQALPIVFQAIRSKEVLKTIYDWDTSVNAGFTGTDIAADQRVNPDKPRSWNFPLLQLNPDAPQPKVYVGSTPNLRERINQPTIEDLEGTTIYTEYPTITRQLLDKEKINARIKSVQGVSEGRWRVDKRNGAIVSIRNTDATLLANEIEPMLDVMSAAVIFIESANISNQDQLRIDDLREQIYQGILSEINSKES